MPDRPLDDLRMLAARYRLLSVLGTGGMGRVWLAEDQLLGRQVAVKEIRFPSDLTAEERGVLRERTLREARLTAQLEHPGIITVYDVVSEQDSPYIVMALITAPSLAAAIDEEGSLLPKRVAQIGLRLLDALDVAHAAGIMHRDVKPSNVLLDGDRVVLSDFGIARSSSDATLTSTGLVVGSPTYMSPERLRSEGVEPGGDLWSLGATLYAALEGHPPFRAGNVMGTITAVLIDEPDPPSVTGPLREAVLGLLEKDPARRLDSGQARSLLQRAGQEAAPTSTEPQVPSDLPVMAPALNDVDPVSRWHDSPAPTPAPAAREPTAAFAPSPSAWLHASPGAESSTPSALPGDVGRTAGKPQPRRKARMVAALAAAVVAVAVVLVVRAFDDDPGSAGADTTGASGPRTDTSPSAGDDPSGTPGEPQGTVGNPDGQDAPAGYRLVSDPLDFTVAVPQSWQRRLDGPTRVDFVSPDGSQFLRVDQAPQAGPDAEQAWLDAEPAIADSLPGYSRIRIEPLDYRGWQSADWEFTWEGESGSVHVLNRGIITQPRGFALYMSGPDASWEEKSLPVFGVAAETFEPSS